MLFKLLDMLKDFSNQIARRMRIIQGDVIGNGVEVAESWLGPDYLSHRDMRFLASA